MTLTWTSSARPLSLALQNPKVPKEAVDQLLDLTHALRQTNDPTVRPVCVSVCVSVCVCVFYRVPDLRTV